MLLCCEGYVWASLAEVAVGASSMPLLREQGARSHTQGPVERRGGRCTLLPSNHIAAPGRMPQPAWVLGARHHLSDATNWPRKAFEGTLSSTRACPPHPPVPCPPNHPSTPCRPVSPPPLPRAYLCCGAPQGARGPAAAQTPGCKSPGGYCGCARAAGGAAGLSSSLPSSRPLLRLE